MPQVVHGPAGHKVQVLLAIGVPDTGALTPNEHHRLAAHRLRVVLVFDGYPLTALGHGELPPRFFRRSSVFISIRQWVVRLQHLEMNATIIGVDGYFYTVADIVGLAVDPRGS
jgi:hypothetical protein